MKIQIYTDNNIDGGARLDDYIRSTVEDILSRSDDYITRVEVHLSEESSHKRIREDKICKMEARLKGHPPVAVTNHASTLDQAVEGAAEKLTHVIKHTLGRLHHREGHRADPPPETNF